MKYFVTTRRNNITNNGPFDRIFDPFFSFKPLTSHMKTDISEIDGNINLEIELAGFEKNDISLELNDGILTVTAEKDEKEENSDKYISRERKTSMSRSFEVGDVLIESIKAKYDNGILTVSYPKESPKAEATKIAIE